MQETIGTKAFTMIPNEIMDNPDIDVYMQSILLVLYRFRNQENNTCFPSYSVLAQYAKCCVRKAKSIVKKLEEMGLVQVCRRAKGRLQAHASNVYILPSMKDTSAAIEDTNELFSLDKITEHKEQQAKDFIEIEGAYNAHPCALDTSPHAQDSLPCAYHAPNQDIYNNNIYQEPSINHSFLNERGNDLQNNCENSQNGSLSQKPSTQQQNAWEAPQTINLKTRENLAQILDEHFGYIENFSIQENSIRMLYQSLRTYMIEMLTDETTQIDHFIEQREDLANLIFSADALTLLDFVNHIYLNGCKETIIHPRAYLKKCLINYIRSNAIHHRNIQTSELGNNHSSAIDENFLKLDKSMHLYQCQILKIHTMLEACKT